MLQNILTNLGLTEKEAKVYLASLEIGTNVVSEIAKKAKINRVTTYDILQKLIEKALVSKFTKNKVKYFTAIEPDNLLSDYQSKVQNLETALPELRRLTGETQHPRIRYFEGLEGIKKIYADTLNSNTEIINYANSAEIRRHWPEYDQQYVSKRVKNNIHLRGISPLDNHGKKVQSEDSKYNREIRLVPGEKFNFTNEINIYDNKVAIISFKDELIGTIIESTEVANTQRAIFNMAWDFASQFTGDFVPSTTTQTPEKAAPIKKKTTPQKKAKVVKTEDPAPLEDQQAMF